MRFILYDPVSQAFIPRSVRVVRQSSERSPRSGPVTYLIILSYQINLNTSAILLTADKSRELLSHSVNQRLLGYKKVVSVTMI